MACEGHLYGSGETLVWLGSDASNTREDCRQYLAGLLEKLVGFVCKTWRHCL